MFLADDRKRGFPRTAAVVCVFVCAFFGVLLWFFFLLRLKRYIFTVLVAFFFFLFGLARVYVQ